MDKNQTIDYEAIRARVDKRYDKIKEFAMHFTAYAMTITAIAALNANVFGDSGFLKIILYLIIFGWGIGIAIHGTETLFEAVIFPHRKERAVQREIELALWEREGRVPSFIGKRKNTDYAVRLGNDGEIVPVHAWEEEAAYQRNDRG